MACCGLCLVSQCRWYDFVEENVDKPQDTIGQDIPEVKTKGHTAASNAESEKSNNSSSVTMTSITSIAVKLFVIFRYEGHMCQFIP